MRKTLLILLICSTVKLHAHYNTVSSGRHASGSGCSDTIILEKDWEIIYIKNIARFHIPPSMEIQTGIYKEYVDMMKNIRGFDTTPIIVQNKGLNDLQSGGFEKYSRVILEYIDHIPQELEQPLQNRKYITKENLSALNKKYENDFRESFKYTSSKIVEWHPLEYKTVNNYNCYKISYTRQYSNKPYVLVNIYYFLREKDMISLTLSYRINETNIWRNDFDKILSSFLIENSDQSLDLKPKIPSLFNPNLTYGEVKDVEGNIYKTIQIGTQTWMAENLRTTKYNNGTPIENIIDGTQWENDKKGAWCYYNNEESNNNPYGKLYNWYAVTNSNQICPKGWHVPTDEEWTTLINFLDPNANGGNNDNITGGKMKSTGTQQWLSPNTDASNSSGFTGIPGGFCYIDGTFFFKSKFGFWWSFADNNISCVVLSYTSTLISRLTHKRQVGFSVRCVKD